jgi:hypothetical protein
MDVEKLIESVKARPLLFKSNKKSYKVVDKKRIAYNAIGEEAGIPRKCSSTTDSLLRIAFIFQI